MHQKRTERVSERSKSASKHKTKRKAISSRSLRWIAVIFDERTYNNNSAERHIHTAKPKWTEERKKKHTEKKNTSEERVNDHWKQPYQRARVATKTHTHRHCVKRTTNKTPETWNLCCCITFIPQIKFICLLKRLCGALLFLLYVVCTRLYLLIFLSVSLRMVTVILKFSFVILIHWQIAVNWESVYIDCAVAADFFFSLFISGYI